MVTDAVWAAAKGGRTYLCIGCLERRLGRKLVPVDFTPLPVNEPSLLDTPRLAARKAGREPTEATG